MGAAALVAWVLTGKGSLRGWDRLGGAAIMLGLSMVIGYTIPLRHPAAAGARKS